MFKGFADVVADEFHSRFADVINREFNSMVSRLAEALDEQSDYVGISSQRLSVLLRDDVVVRQVSAIANRILEEHLSVKTLVDDLVDDTFAAVVRRRAAREQTRVGP